MRIYVNKYLLYLGGKTQPAKEFASLVKMVEIFRRLQVMMQRIDLLSRM